MAKKFGSRLVEDTLATDGHRYTFESMTCGGSRSSQGAMGGLHPCHRREAFPGGTDPVGYGRILTMDSRSREIGHPVPCESDRWVQTPAGLPCGHVLCTLIEMGRAMFGFYQRLAVRHGRLNAALRLQSTPSRTRLTVDHCTSGASL